MRSEDWIPVEQAMPEPMVECFVAFDNRAIGTACFNDVLGMWEPSSVINCPDTWPETVLYWMQIPELPKEEVK